MHFWLHCYRNPDPARQTAEVQLRCAILNTYNRLGMPDTVAIT